MSFDQKCFDLATHFLPHASVTSKSELAEALQAVVEDYLRDYEEGLEIERQQIARREAKQL